MQYKSVIHADFGNSVTHEDQLGFDIIEIKTGKIVDMTVGRKFTEDKLDEWNAGCYDHIQKELDKFHVFSGTTGRYYAAAAHATTTGHRSGSSEWLNAIREKMASRFPKFPVPEELLSET